VGIKETFADTIRIVIMVHMLVVAAVFAGPKKNGILKCGSAEDDRKEPHNPVSLESQMRKKSMVPEGDRESTSSQHGKKKNDLKSINAKEPEVRWYGRD